MCLARLFRFKRQTKLDLQHGGVYFVTTDTEFSDVTAPYLHCEPNKNTPKYSWLYLPQNLVN